MKRCDTLAARGAGANSEMRGAQVVVAEAEKSTSRLDNGKSS